MKKNQIYEGGCHTVYFQHLKNCNSLEYSIDKGATWNDVPVDIGKINYHSVWFRLKL